MFLLQADADVAPPAARSLRGGALLLVFDADSGNLTVGSLVGRSASSHVPEAVVGEAAVAPRLRAAGAKLVHQRYICNLDQMDCEWVDAAGAHDLHHPDSVEIRAPKADSGHSRIVVRTADVQVCQLRIGAARHRGPDDYRMTAKAITMT